MLTLEQEPQIHSLDDAFDRDRFLMVQKRLALTHKYYISDEQNQRLLYVERELHMMQQLLTHLATTSVVLLFGVGGVAASVSLDNLPVAIRVVAAFCAVLLAAIAGFLVFSRLNPLRHITFYRDETRGAALLSITQDNRVQSIFANFTVLDADGRPLAKLKKNQLTNLFRKRWECMFPDGTPMCVAMEDSIVLSVLRRLFGPMMGVLRTHFILLAGTGFPERLLGKFDRQFTLFDKYVFDLSNDPGREVDRRVALAIGVLLDTGERR